jgi:hypothetical protein
VSKHEQPKEQIMTNETDDDLLAEIIAALTPEKCAQLQAEADANGESLRDVIGHAVYWVNIEGSPAEQAHLINIGYAGTDCECRDFAAAIAARRLMEAFEELERFCLS